MGRGEERKGGGATVSICASLDSAAMAGREGLPRCGFHNKMINDVFVLSYKTWCMSFPLKPCIKIHLHEIEECKRHGIKTSNISVMDKVMVEDKQLMDGWICLCWNSCHLILTVFNLKFKHSIYWQGRLLHQWFSSPQFPCILILLHVQITTSKFNWFQSKMTLIFAHLKWPGSP